jgi:hypothetical protein
MNNGLLFEQSVHSRDDLFRKCTHVSFEGLKLQHE